MNLTKNENSFARAITDAKKLYYRDMPWRHELGGTAEAAYKILVSEIMLQQTKVDRVVPKYKDFLVQFPNIETLAHSNLSDVLKLWNGLGYNRRARYVHDAAKLLQSIHSPWSTADLLACKGIGPNTAAAVRVYAYNEPEIFIETNIRTVCIHYFFAQEKSVTDSQILHLVERYIEKSDPRKWYWALMDEGARLKGSKQAVITKSASYKKQPTFQGSRRQIRGNVLKLLIAGPVLEELVLDQIQDMRTNEVIKQLQCEGLVSCKLGVLHLGTIE